MVMKNLDSLFSAGGWAMCRAVLVGQNIREFRQNIPVWRGKKPQGISGGRVEGSFERQHEFSSPRKCERSNPEHRDIPAPISNRSRVTSVHICCEHYSKTSEESNVARKAGRSPLSKNQAVCRRARCADRLPIQGHSGPQNCLPVLRARTQYQRTCT